MKVSCSVAGALKGAEIVIIPAGVPRKPGMTWVNILLYRASQY